jgi:hypothetical protein
VAAGHPTLVIAGGPAAVPQLVERILGIVREPGW